MCAIDRMLRQALSRGFPGLARKVIVMEVKACECPWDLRTEAEHRFCRKRAEILRRLAARKGFDLTECDR